MTPDRAGYDVTRLHALFESSPLGGELDVRGAVDSTNSIAREHAERGAGHGTLVIADEQRRGRGRLERGWYSPPGVGLWMTIVTRPELGPLAGALVPLAAGVGAAEGLERLHTVRIALKWPNDVMMDGRKLGGILVESATRGDRLHWALVGIGINLTTPPEAFPADVGPHATSLRQAGIERVDREATAIAVAVGVVSAVERLESDASGLLEAFETRDALRGRRVRVHGARLHDRDPTVEASFEGTASGIDPTGALRVDVDGERHVVRMGSIRVIDP